MGCHKSNAKKEVYSDKHLLLETRYILNKQSKFTS